MSDKNNETPSSGCVPFPNSSIKSKERFWIEWQTRVIRVTSCVKEEFESVTLCMIQQTKGNDSAIMNFDAILWTNSIQLYIENNPNVAASAGTKQPIWLRYTVNAICFMYTDLPLLFGPVRMMTFCDRAGPIYWRRNKRETSIGFGMNWSDTNSWSGCRLFYWVQFNEKLTVTWMMGSFEMWGRTKEHSEQRELHDNKISSSATTLDTSQRRVKQDCTRFATNRTIFLSKSRIVAWISPYC